MPASARFWDKVAAKYAAQPIADEAAYQRKLAKTQEYLAPHMQILEIGCGTGGTAITHAPFVAHIRAVDISKEMIAIAKSKAAEAGVDNVSFEVAEVGALSVPDGSLDAVLALSILHLLEDKEAAIASIHRMLKPGGHFISSTVCLGDYMAWFKYVAPIGRMLGKMPLVKVFGARHLEETIAAAGFDIEHSWQPGEKRALFLVAKKPA